MPFLVARASSWAETRVVVATDQRARATKALTATLGRFVVDETAPHVARFFLPHAAPGGSWTLGEEYACLVEFWEVVEGNRLSRPGSKPISTIGPDLDATVLAEHGTGQRLTLAALLHRPPEAVDGPIDIVYTWVDGSEDNWLKRRARYSGESPVGATSDERFRQQDELRFSLRSVENFAPWVRHVWIVTDAQVPRWLKPGDPDVTIVDHREIAPFPDALPVFNSHAIEAWLHRIPGISANFIYMNDDVFFGRPVTPEQFFLPGGVCKVFPSPTSLPGRRDPDAQLPHFAAALNGLDLLTERFGKAQYTTFLHTPHALSSGLLAEIAQDFPVDWAATARSRWRSNSDLSVVSFLHHVFGLMTGRAVVSEISSAFVNPSLFDHLPRLAGLRERKRDVFCINDYGKGEIDYEGRRRLVERFLRDYYPLRSALEASGAI